jgi:translation initiation factor IF-3
VDKTIEEYKVNRDIRASQVRVVTEEGQMLGILSLQDALFRARELDMDLVEIAPQSSPPVCKILNYQKFKYEQHKKAKEVAKKNRESRIETKEIWLRPVTEQHDLETKIRRSKEFLEDGDKVRFIVKFKGRELSHTDQGTDLLNKVINLLGVDIKIEAPIRLAGKQLTLVVTSGKVK